MKLPLKKPEKMPAPGIEATTDADVARLVHAVERVNELLEKVPNRYSLWYDYRRRALSVQSRSKPNKVIAPKEP